MVQVIKYIRKNGDISMYEYPKEDISRYYKNYKERHPEVFENITCPRCDANIKKAYLKRHQATKICERDRLRKLKKEGEEQQKKKLQEEGAKVDFNL